MARMMEDEPEEFARRMQQVAGIWEWTGSEPGSRLASQSGPRHTGAMTELQLRARTVSEIVDAAFGLYRRNATRYIAVASLA